MLDYHILVSLIDAPLPLPFHFGWADYGLDLPNDTIMIATSFLKLRVVN
jgi:hypothetical protein